MQKSKLLLPTYDARLTKLKITPKCFQTKVSYKLKIYDNLLKKNVVKNICFKEVIAIEFAMNYFDNPIGTEVCGFYEIYDKSEKQAILERNYISRKKGFLFHNNYNYDADDEHDMLNYRKTFEEIKKNLDLYHLYQQQTTGGIYLLLAKEWFIT